MSEGRSSRARRRPRRTAGRLGRYGCHGSPMINTDSTWLWPRRVHAARLKGCPLPGASRLRRHSSTMAPTGTAPPTPERRAATETSGVGVPSGIGCHAFWLLFGWSHWRGHSQSPTTARRLSAEANQQAGGDSRQAQRQWRLRQGAQDSVTASVVSKTLLTSLGVGRGAVVSGRSRRRTAGGRRRPWSTRSPSMLTVIEPLTTHQDLMGSPPRGRHIPRLGAQTGSPAGCGPAHGRAATWTDIRRTSEEARETWRRVGTLRRQ